MAILSVEIKKLWLNIPFREGASVFINSVYQQCRQNVKISTMSLDKDREMSLDVSRWFETLLADKLNK